MPYRLQRQRSTVLRYWQKVLRFPLVLQRCDIDVAIRCSHIFPQQFHEVLAGEFQRNSRVVDIVVLPLRGDLQRVFEVIRQRVLQH